MAEINKSYEPGEVERRWYDAWQRAGAFAGRADAGQGALLHRHSAAERDGGARRWGTCSTTACRTSWSGGRAWRGGPRFGSPAPITPGIATQTVVERELRKQKKTRRDLGREKFVEKVWEWRGEKGDIILEQLRRLGASCDWDRTQFTMDPAYSRSVLAVFVELFRRGRIYRGKRMVNWCPASQTALSDEEVIMKPVTGAIYEVRYELADAPAGGPKFIAVKTTRPETIPGDVALAVHPEDPRYAGLVGRKAWRPINRALIPVVADAAVDREFGTGALKITPAHDKTDFEIGQRHGLPADRRPPAERRPQRAGRPGAGGPGAVRGAEEGGGAPEGVGGPCRRGAVREQCRLFGAGRCADRAAADLAMVAALPAGRGGEGRRA